MPKQKQFPPPTSNEPSTARDAMSKTQSNTARSTRSRKLPTTSNALEIIEQRFLKKNPAFRAMVEQATVNARVAKLIHDARTAAGLTQKQLADLIRTKQPVIARLEDAQYDGHSLSMLQRIARALGRDLHIQLAPMKQRYRKSA